MTTPPRIAILVLAHANPAIFARLAEALRHPAIEVFAHLDARTDLAAFRGEATSHVRFLPDRIANHWGSWTQVEAALRLFRAARAAGPFAAYALVSGDTLPLLRPGAIARILATTPTVLDASPIKPGRRQHRRVTGIYLPQTRLGRMNAKVDHMDRSLEPDEFAEFEAAMRTLPAKRSFGFTVFKASQWISLSDGHVAALFDLMERDPTFVDVFRYSLMPDEMFFATALNRLDPALPRRLGFMDFEWPRGPSPLVLSHPADLGRVRVARSLFFRKFCDAGGALADAVLQARLGLREAREAGWPLAGAVVEEDA